MKGRKTGGRKPGSRNKITEEVRVALLKAFHAVGEADYLEEVARTNPAIFCTLLGKILPHELATSTEPITHEVVLKWMTPEMAKNRGYDFDQSSQETTGQG